VTKVWTNVITESIISVAGYIDIDCGLSEDDIPSVVKILESPAGCNVDCDDDDGCPASAVQCSRVGLNTVNATYNATCLFHTMVTSRDVKVLRPAWS